MPVNASTGTVRLQAFDHQGLLIGEDEIVIQSTASNALWENLRITEIHYKPTAPTAAELRLRPNLTDNDFEFVELTNVGTTAVNLFGTSFRDGIRYVFPDVEVAAGERVVVVKDADAFRLRYGGAARIVGVYQGSLNNGGELIALARSDGSSLLALEYDSGLRWPHGADGYGSSLELRDAAATPLLANGQASRWRGSVTVGGSPGATGSPAAGVRINEVLARSDAEKDAIEVVNISAESIDIGGWILTDDLRDETHAFAIPTGTRIEPGQFWFVDESQFGASVGGGHFRLNGSEGEDLWLYQPRPDGSIAEFVDGVRLNAARLDESSGRLPNGTGTWGPLANLSLGHANELARVGPLVLSEVHLNPEAPRAEALAIDATITANDLAFIEISNTSRAPVDLDGYTLSGTAAMTFGRTHRLLAGQSAIVVSFDASLAANAPRRQAFRAHYALADNGLVWHAMSVDRPLDGGRLVLVAAGWHRRG